jgi:mannose-6-phosphate isomerase-like protein (cupin superfamily)
MSDWYFDPDGEFFVHAPMKKAGWLITMGWEEKDMYDEDVVALAKANHNFRQVLFTGEHTQLVIMSLKPKEDIGLEVHHNNDQILYVVEGQGIAEINDKTKKVESGDFLAVPAGMRHNVSNAGEGDLKIVTIYGPPDHKPHTVHPTKSDALKDEGPPEQ